MTLGLFLQEQGNGLREPYSKHLMMILRSAEKLERIFRGSCISSLWGKDHSDERLYQKTQKHPRVKLNGKTVSEKILEKERENR